MAARFGDDNVFMDVDMAPGVDFVQRITEAVAGCQVLIVVMGPEWATAQDEQGTARLANPEDFVRLEVETALKRPEVTPIPVLVSGARMPRREDLPAEVRAITRRNALELSDHRWRSDVGRLMGTLDELLGEAPAVPAQPSRERKTEPPPTSRRRLWWAVLPVLAIVAIVVAVVAATGGGGGNEDEDQITSVLETEWTTTDPADCRKLYTQRFLDQTQFVGSGPEAVKGCAADTQNTGDNPDSVEVTDVQVSGNVATAEALYTGGLFDGQTLVYSLLKGSDQWKLDRLDDFKEFDLQSFADAFAETGPKFTNPLTQEQASCAAQVFASQSPDEVKAGLLSGDLEQLFQSPERCGIDL